MNPSEYIISVDGQQVAVVEGFAACLDKVCEVAREYPRGWISVCCPDSVDLGCPDGITQQEQSDIDEAIAIGIADGEELAAMMAERHGAALAHQIRAESHRVPSDAPPAAKKSA